MKRLVKKANGFKYQAISPIIINEWNGDYDSHFSADQLAGEDYNELIDAVKSEMDEMGPSGLAQYISDDKSIKDGVTSIIVTVKGGQAVTNIECSRELLLEELDDLKDYLTGQFSDGWGEGFEQRPFVEWTSEEQDEDWDEEEQELYMSSYSQDNSYSASFWNSEKFNIEIKKI